MLYQVSRNGQVYGPYTLEDLQRYLASGNVLPTDLAKGEEMSDWVPVSQLLGTQSVPPPAGFPAQVYVDPVYGQMAMSQNNAALAASPYPDAPNLQWGLVLLFSILTCGVFMFIWNLIVAAWLRRVQPTANSLFLYIGAVVLLVFQVFEGGLSGAHHTSPHGIHFFPGNPLGGLLVFGVWVVRLLARYSQRASLEEHFNGPEPVGLRLNPVLTFFFGGLYFQHHLNRINAIKQAARFSAGRAY